MVGPQEVGVVKFLHGKNVKKNCTKSFMAIVVQVSDVSHGSLVLVQYMFVKLVHTGQKKNSFSKLKFIILL